MILPVLPSTSTTPLVPVGALSMAVETEISNVRARLARYQREEWEDTCKHRDRMFHTVIEASEKPRHPQRFEL
jgi:hypothetical protein